ncbi:hypothetical protein [Streptomyces zagrosensis]|uniref:Uncharacterized protein n=1 Tax=Streptomyces zagrosensis TaxID=1042984 RepID=A0A7W9Q647_9ACTN|nr:hypothetical protein [Streptomyces zagrosensis]MBB5933262.1 hypothetical protein [Streptomyces zagrosensis]
MAKVRTETAEARQLGSPASQLGSNATADVMGAGKHRGPAAAEHRQEPVQGKHRRPAGE